MLHWSISTKEVVLNHNHYRLNKLKTTVYQVFFNHTNLLFINFAHN